MELSKEDIARIEAYLDGKLEAADLAALKQRMEEDEAFAAEVRHMAGQRELLRAGRRMQLREQLAGVEADIQRKRLRNRRAVYAIASVLLIAIGLQFFLPSKTSGPDLYDSYFQPYLLGGPQRGNEPPTPYDDAWEAYKNGDYANATAYFDTVSSGHADYQNIQLYKAISQLGLGKTTQAIAGLKAISADPSHPFVEEALFFQGLAHLRLDQMEEAKRIFDTFIEMDGSYRREDVQSIIKSIQ